MDTTSPNQNETYLATWIEINEFAKLSGMEIDKVQELVANNTLKSMTKDDIQYIDANTGTNTLVAKTQNSLLNLSMEGKELDMVFVEKSIGTIMALHEKVINGKDETITAYKGENKFLKDALLSMQDVYDDDKHTMETLRKELERAREEIDFLNKKYKAMWGKVTNMVQ